MFEMLVMFLAAHHQTNFEQFIHAAGWKPIIIGTPDFVLSRLCMVSPLKRRPKTPTAATTNTHTHTRFKSVHTYLYWVRNIIVVAVAVVESARTFACASVLCSGCGSALLCYACGIVGVLTAILLLLVFHIYFVYMSECCICCCYP